MPSTSAFLALPGAPGVAPNMPIELPRDFESISYILEQPLYIGASHKSGINTVADVIRMAKEKPGEVTYAATGRGRLTHLTMELLQARTGIKLQLVPYAGGPAQAMNDVMSGRVPLVLDGYAGLAPAIKGDLIKGLASTALEAAARVREPADRRRDRSGFLRRRLDRAAGAEGHARGDPAQGAQRHAHRAGRSRHPGQARAQRRLRAAHDVAGAHRVRAERAEDLAADPGAGREQRRRR